MREVRATRERWYTSNAFAKSLPFAPSASPSVTASAIAMRARCAMYCVVMTIHRRLGELLRGRGEFSIFPMPFPLPEFTVKQQHWHARFHEDAGNRWLRAVIAELMSEMGSAFGRGPAGRHWNSAQQPDGRFPGIA